MHIIEIRISYQKRGEEFRLYPFGDVHWGTRACDEDAARAYLAKLEADDHGIGILGGDIIEAIPHTDPRYDRQLLAGWCRDAIDPVLEQKRYALSMLEPCKDKWLGAIEGNHERALRDKQGRDTHGALCEALGIPDLTYSAWIRLVFVRKSANTKTAGSTATYLIHIAHGSQAGGILAGAEKNRLGRRMERYQADLCLVGHSHWREILDDRQKFTIPRKGRLPKECRPVRPIAANWGTYFRTAPRGPSSYAERREYDPKDIGGIIVTFRPDRGDIVVEKDWKPRGAKQ